MAGIRLNRAIDVDTLGVGLLVGGWKIAKELTDFFLLELLSAVFFTCLCISRTAGGEDHVVDQFSYSLTVLVVEYLTDYTL